MKVSENKKASGSSKTAAASDVYEFTVEPVPKYYTLMKRISGAILIYFPFALLISIVAVIYIEGSTPNTDLNRQIRHELNIPIRQKFFAERSLDNFNSKMGKLKRHGDQRPRARNGKGIIGKSGVNEFQPFKSLYDMEMNKEGVESRQFIQWTYQESLLEKGIKKKDMKQVEIDIEMQADNNINASEFSKTHIFGARPVLLKEAAPHKGNTDELIKSFIGKEEEQI